MATTTAELSHFCSTGTGEAVIVERPGHKPLRIFYDSEGELNRHLKAAGIYSYERQAIFRDIARCRLAFWGKPPTEFRCVASGLLRDTPRGEMEGSDAAPRAFIPWWVWLWVALAWVWIGAVVVLVVGRLI